MTDHIGNCRILGEIGSGGMAVVYKAIQEPLGRTVAIKALKPSIAMDSQFAKRFEREAHFMATLQHENILHVIDFIKDGRSMYIIMEYVEGIDLYDLLEATPTLEIEVACIIALQVCRALDYAHFRGIIHRDIKPANVMISKSGEVKLMDFGIARDERLSDLTETGTGLGTPSYMSPEQILGDKLDFRSDIFSIGIVLYQMLTGQKPFIEDDARTVMQKIRLDRYESPRRITPKVPRQVERILSRCMEKMPANRYPTTQALIDDLTEFLSPRVPMNYSARLVMYMRDVGVLKDDEANEILAASASRSVRHGGPRDKTLLRHVGAFQAAMLAATVGGGLTIQAASGRLFSDAVDFSQPNSRVIPDRAGHLQVVVDPWADVHIDGQKVVTTPTAKRIALSPGKHYVRFENPYYISKQEEIRIVTNELTVLDVEMQPKVGEVTEPEPAPTEMRTRKRRRRTKGTKK